MNAVLDLRVKRRALPIPDADWHWKSEASALVYMIDHSGIGEKAIAIEIELDASTLAKVKQGAARLSAECLDRLMDATGSDAWLYYWLLRRGYDPHSLRKLESETERRARLAEEALAEERLKNRVLMEAIGGRAQA
jgi:hypothetical protein